MALSWVKSRHLGAIVQRIVQRSPPKFAANIQIFSDLVSCRYMSTRPPAEFLIRDLTTKADKIRTLHNAGYSRKEISSLLGIRYQHVRNVLIRSGLTNSERSQALVPQSPVPVPLGPATKIPPANLLKSGFRQAGYWLLTAEDEITLEGIVPTVPGVYVFVLQEEVVYVGLTLRSLRGRMNQYKRGNLSQRTSARVNGLIKSALQGGKTVSVLIAAPESSTWHDLPVSTAPGLEVGLIQAIKPQWNIQIGRRIA